MAEAEFVTNYTDYYYYYYYVYDYDYDYDYCDYYNYIYYDYCDEGDYFIDSFEFQQVKSKNVKVEIGFYYVQVSGCSLIF